MFENTNWSPTDSEISRPSVAMRSWSGVFGIACSMPVIETGMRASWMKRSCSSKIDASSWSKPTIIPACTWMPYDWILRTFSTRSPRMFCVFLVSCSDDFRGLSMPMKMVVKLAARSSSSSSSSWATFSETSVLK